MNSAYDRRLQNLTCVAFTRSPAVARREQSRVLAELVTAFRNWARDARTPAPHAGARHAEAGSP
jgi:hypothetical protein